jgi:uncharacterized protein (DUF427 family)
MAGTASVKTAGKAPGNVKNPDHIVRLEASPRRVRVVVDGETVADTTRAMLLYETNHLPVYYFPISDVRTDLMERTDHTTHCPYKGDAAYWTIKAGNKACENAMWSYETPYDEVPELAGLAAFYWNRVDHWYEEDEEIFVHPRDPHKRVDTVPSSREVAVVLGGETVAKSTRAMFLFETGLPTRYYIPQSDVRMDLLSPTDTVTRCPYKGVARYWSAEVGGRRYEDIVWSYPDPVPECPKIKGLMCFYNENVDAVTVDGEEIPKPRTKWSRE